MSKSLLAVLTLAIVAAFAWFHFREKKQDPASAFAYPAPRIPSHRFQKLDDEHLMKLARIAVRQSRSETRLGLIRPGQKTLILVPPNQDQRVIKAILAALKERGVEADAVTEAEIFKVAFGTDDELN